MERSSLRRRIGKRAVWAPAVFFTLWTSTRLAAGTADFVISEILAVNETVLRDEDGDFSDWIEIHNAGAEEADIGGWYLSDDPLELTKWRFPPRIVPPGGYLIVFASDKDRRPTAGELHANFKLSSRGEPLFLVAPDGRTVVWAYDPFPPQVADISYGLRQNAAFLRLVESGSPARAIVPANGALGLSWTDPDFDDATWRAGTLGAGYDRNTTYRPLIGLDIGDLMDGVNTSAYVRVPFQVDDPSGLGSLRLRMKYDDGFIAYINGVEVARANAPASPSWDSDATSLHDDALAVVFEEFDLPGAASLLRAGTNVLAIHGLNDNPGSSDFLILPELEATGEGTLEREVEEFFPQPTPGAANVTGFEGVAALPSFSLPSLTFSGSITVELLAGSSEEEIRYTTDGSEPTRESPLYTGPIVLSTTTQLRARAFRSGYAPSPIVSQTYLALDSSVRNFSSDIPLVVVENFGAGSVPANTFQPAWIGIFDRVDGRSALRNLPALETRAGIKIRGSSTQNRPKKTYGFEAWDEKNEDKDIAPLGLPEESDWILYGPYNFDRALMRNPFIYEMSRLAGRYAARTRFVEVFVNTGGGALTSGDYAGVYCLMEKIKRGPDRVDVERLSPSAREEPEVSGGYILKIDRLDPGDSGFSAGGQRIAHVYPKERDIAPEQQAWIKNYIDRFVNVLNGPSFRDPVNGYVGYIDVPSWIDHHILNVLAKNVDALRLSAYFFKRRSRPIEFGPIWDFDRSMDSTDGRDNDPRTWDGTGDATRFFSYPWWGRLFQDPDFWQAWRDRWFELRQGPLSVDAMWAVIDGMAAEIEEAQARDAQKWQQTTPSGWRNEVAKLKNWLAVRAEWIDSQFPPVPVFNLNGGKIQPGFRLGMSAPQGTIYFTLDGRDPRLRGGGIAPSASAFTAPLTLEENTRVIARTRVSDSAWSAPRDATFVVRTPRLVISEIMYHPAPPPAGSSFSREDFEFLELFNADTQPIPLAGVRIREGVAFEFPLDSPLVLAPGEYAVLVKNEEAFAERYGEGAVLVGGEYEGNLENRGERLVLEGPLHEPILDFAYSDVWFPETDGAGFSLTILDPAAPFETWGEPDAWTQSSVEGGTPGYEDGGLPPLAGRRLPGDGNEDGVLDVSDAFILLLRLFGGTDRPLPCDGGRIDEGGNLALHDVNADGGVDITDAVHILDYLFRGGAPPVLGETCRRIEGCASRCAF